MRYHYSSPYENDPSSPYEKKPDPPEDAEESESPEDAPPLTPPTPPPGGVKWSRGRLALAGGIVLLITAIILGVLVHTVAPGSRTTVAAPTATAVPKILYSADWSHGDSGWTLPAHWSLVKGQMENDGYGSAPLPIPYEVTQPNYTISVDFTVQSVPDYKACHSYGISGFSSGNDLQFLGDIDCLVKLVGAYHGFSDNFVPHAASGDTGLSSQDYLLQYYTQTFISRVQGQIVDFCPGALNCLANQMSATPLSPLHIALYDIGVRLTVSRIVITSP